MQASQEVQPLGTVQQAYARASQTKGQQGPETNNMLPLSNKKSALLSNEQNKGTLGDEGKNARSRYG